MPGLAPTDQTGPTNLSDLLFLQGMYDAGAKDYFDIATVMVYGYGYSPSDRRVEFARNNFSRPIQTHEIMVKNGDADKAIWAAEYGWVSLPSNWTGDPSPWGKPVSQETQAKYLYQGYLRAQQEWPWMGVMCVWNFRQPLPADAPGQAGNPTRGFSIVEHDFSPTPAYTLLKQKSHSLDLAFTGAYRSDSPYLQHDSGWTLTTVDGQNLLTAERQGGTARIDFSGTRLDLLLTSNVKELEVQVDGHPVSLKPDGTIGSASRFTVASGLSDGPHQAEILSVGSTVDISEFVVVRHTIMSWIYPWIYAALALTLLLNLVSLAWTLRARRRVPFEHPAPGRVVSANEIRANRMTSQRPKP